MASSTDGSTSASVATTASMVSMSGSIIPTPLAMPTTRAAPALAVATFGWVSVVIIAVAAAVAEPGVANGEPAVRRAVI